MASDLAAFGAVPTPESQRYLQAQQEAAAAPFEVLWRNRRAVELFLFCQSQWSAAPMGGRMGLNYVAVRGQMLDRGWSRKRRADVMARVHLVEHAALAEWQRQHEAAAGRRGS